MAKFSVASSWFSTLKNWANLLRNLTFAENFKGYEWEGTISNGEVKRISHNLGVPPTKYLVTYRETAGVIAVPSVPSYTPTEVLGYKATSSVIYLTAISDNFRGKILILP